MSLIGDLIDEAVDAALREILKKTAGGGKRARRRSRKAGTASRAGRSRATGSRKTPARQQTSRKRSVRSRAKSRRRAR